MYQVIVGNVGTVYNGESLKEAMELFDGYRTISKTEGSSRASGESVRLYHDDEIILEFVGYLDIE